jgi:5-methylcytosine-specific restriction protein A
MKMTKAIKWTLSKLKKEGKLFSERQLRLDIYFKALESYREMATNNFASVIEKGDDLTRERMFDDIEHLLVDVPKAQAEKKAERYGLPSWAVLRRLIYERDKGICAVCGQACSFGAFDLGHLVDRFMGGTDNPDNLTVMHSHCNQLKPFHDTKEDALAWTSTKPIQRIWEEAVEEVLNLMEVGNATR